MELFDFFPVCYLMRDLEYLRAATLGKFPVMGEQYIYAALKRVRNLISKYELHENVLPEMNVWIRRLKKRYKGMQKLRQDDADNLNTWVIEWTRVLEDRFLYMKLLELRTKGRINYLSLIDEGARFFFEKKKNWNKLSVIAKEDLENAGDCLLSDIPTPSVMLCLRVVEDVFRKYYRRKTKKEVDGKRWVECVDDLKKRYNVNQTLVGHLDFIRKYGRNPAQHPDKRFSDREAENIFLRCIEVIEEMYEDSK